MFVYFVLNSMFNTDCKDLFLKTKLMAGTSKKNTSGRRAYTGSLPGPSRADDAALVKGYEGGGRKKERRCGRGWKNAYPPR
jgi:hypothetical protein